MDHPFGSENNEVVNKEGAGCADDDGANDGKNSWNGQHVLQHSESERVNDSCRKDNTIKTQPGHKKTKPRLSR